MKLELAGRDKQGAVRLHVDVQNQFSTTGHWLRGIFHCHVDQIAEPHAVCEHYQQLGFDFLGSSDNLDGDFIAIPTCLTDIGQFNVQ